MSDQTSLFGTNNLEATPPSNTPQNPASPDPVVTMLQAIKNEKGEPKYKSVEDALKALQHSQAYIPTLSDEKKRLEQELEEARLQASKVSELEATVARMLSSSQNTSSNTAPVSIDESKIEELVTRTLTKTKAQEDAAKNTSIVIQAVASRFGDKAEEAFYGKAAELGMSKAEMNQLAATRPKAVLSLLGIQETVVPNTSRQSTQGTAINTSGLAPQTDTFIGRNKEPAIVGATTQQLKEESDRARKMVDELHSSGMTVHDLTDPKVFFKHFR
jgi:hypothetical protein